ncbi:MAG: 4Fe-4S dicluster domain-containing protein [Coriobacteriales bacterium]|jgi:ferredoxin|nr:4Fe-4S dicluster domain-containing protein [Coriobacteriales bacterium]
MSDIVIYYFSATGNSLAAARALAERLDAPLPISVPGSLVNDDPYSAITQVKAVGFVFPVQRATIPEMLRGFIKAMPVNRHGYYFALATYSLFGSNVFEDIDELLSAKGAMLNYAASVRMMGNVGVGEPSDATIQRRLSQMDTKLDEVAGAVSYHQENYFPRANKLLGEAVRRFTENRRRTIVFRVDKHCKKCGICVQVCPAQNIRIPKKGSTILAPVRSDKCEACLACVHWCPASAVGTPTRLHTRYHNPMISPQQLNQTVPD